MTDNRDAIDREVQRRVTEALSSAGVGQGRIDLEVLYMLPPSFVRAYRRIYDRAFKESASGAGAVDEGRMPAKRKDWGKRVGVGGGGKRYRVHWIVKSEKWFKVKGRWDRKLERLARDMEKELEGKEGETGKPCQSCGLELAELTALSRRRVICCPWCGESVGKA